jgi:hypothetical protein
MLTSLYPVLVAPVTCSLPSVVGVMGNQDLALILDAALAEITRPHRLNEPLIPIVRDALCQLGFLCDESTPRTDLIAQIWARKRPATLVVVPLT